MAFFFVFAFLAILALSVSFYEIRHFKIKEYSIKSGKLKGEALKIAFISDLHSCSYGKNNVKLEEALRNENPDLILIGGDTYTAEKKSDNTAAEEFICDIAGKYQTLYALGNHEYRFAEYPEKFPGIYERFLKLLEDCKITLLDNNHYELDIKGNRLVIYGLTLEREYYKRFHSGKLPQDLIVRRLKKVSGDTFSILLAHNPAFFEAYSKWQPDLILSGHYHGGIARLKNLGMISPYYRLFPKYAYGLIQDKQTKMIVSGGLGQHTIPVRLLNPPELVMIHLNTND